MAEFGIYDISGWNANVSLEYWLARGEDLYIALDRTQRQAGGRHVPSDLGLDRFQYTTFGHLDAASTS